MSLTCAFALGMLAMYIITGIGFMISTVLEWAYISESMMITFCWWIVFPLILIRLIRNAIRKIKTKRLDKAAQK